MTPDQQRSEARRLYLLAEQCADAAIKAELSAQADFLMEDAHEGELSPSEREPTEDEIDDWRLNG